MIYTDAITQIKTGKMLYRMAWRTAQPKGENDCLRIAKDPIDVILLTKINVLTQQIIDIKTQTNSQESKKRIAHLEKEKVRKLKKIRNAFVIYVNETEYLPTWSPSEQDKEATDWELYS